MPGHMYYEHFGLTQAPWSFKIMVGLAVLYLAWRLVEGIVWVVQRFI